MVLLVCVPLSPNRKPALIQGWETSEFRNRAFSLSIGSYFILSFLFGLQVCRLKYILAWTQMSRTNFEKISIILGTDGQELANLQAALAMKLRFLLDLSKDYVLWTDELIRWEAWWATPKEGGSVMKKAELVEKMANDTCQTYTGEGCDQFVTWWAVGFPSSFQISITLSATCSGVDLYYYKYANSMFATNNLCYSLVLWLDQAIK